MNETPSFEADAPPPEPQNPPVPWKLPAPPPPPTGRIDIHSHLLPGLDDGCETVAESLECIRRLIAAGYSGTICTPHIIPEEFPKTDLARVESVMAELRQAIADARLNYTIWPGGELRLSDDMVDWCEEHGAPTLAGSRCVLVDAWDDHWPKSADPCLEWLLESDFQPILAHPERMPLANPNALVRLVTGLHQRGVWLQGNLRSITGEEGYAARVLLGRWIEEGRYRLLALDMHRLETLGGRLDGLHLVEVAFGDEVVEALTVAAPRDLILQPEAGG